MKNFRIASRESVYFLVIVLMIIGASALNLTSVFRTFTSDLFERYGGLFYSRLYKPAVYLSYPIYIFAITVVINKARRVFAYKILLWVVISFAAFILVGSFYLNFLEAQNYANFVFSKYHIYLPWLKSYAEFHLILVLGALFFYLKIKINFLNYILSVRNVSVFFLALIFYGMTLDYPHLLSIEYLYWRNYILLPINQKQQAIDLGDFSNQMLFIKMNTPENAVIVHPTQSNEFPLAGNQPLLTYFLYPRVMVSPDAEENYNESAKGIDTREVFYILDMDTEQKTYFPTREMYTVEIRLLLADGKVGTYKGVDYNAVFVNSLPDFKIGIVKRTR